MTGFLARNVGVQLEALNPYYTVYVEHLRCCVEAKNFYCDFIVGPSDGDVKLIADFARNVKNCVDKNNGRDRCKRRNYSESVLMNCPIKNPLFLPDSKSIGEVF